MATTTTTTTSHNIYLQKEAIGWILPTNHDLSTLDIEKCEITGTSFPNICIQISPQQE